jgi:ankyrin repeat protein
MPEDKNMAILQNPAALLRPATPKNQPASGWQTASLKTQPERLHLDIDQRDKDGATALIRAAEKGDLKTVRTLLENGADINAADKNGWTALMKAVKGHHLKTTADLITAGANIHAETRNGWNVLSIAVKTGAPEVIALIASVAGEK